MSWKETLANAYTAVPKSLKEFSWRASVALFALSSVVTGFTIWKNPGLIPNAISGLPHNRQSPVEILHRNPELRARVYEKMSQYFFAHRPFGLMFVSWEEVDEFVGLWVRPADRFPGKSGVHDLTPDMRVLGGPFLFGECAFTESLALPGKTMVACPIRNDYDVWGYVAAVVDSDTQTVENSLRLVRLLAHRITTLIY